MRNLTVLLLGSALSSVAAQASAQSIQCDQQYTVASGDFLSNIAQRAYGNISNFNRIYDANVDVIGPNPGIIRVGQRLYIPCLSGSSAAAETVSADTSPAPGDSGPIRVLTASSWAPFLDEGQEQGGLLTEIINLALANADGSPDYRIDFVDDRSAHLDPLVSSEVFDISIGWSKPNCEDTALLGDESKARCDNLSFSTPMYEEVFGYFTAASDPIYQDHQELSGKTICRADGFSLLPLETVGLTEPGIVVVRASDEASCIDLLVEGVADVAVVALDPAEARIAALEARETVKLQENLSFPSILYAVTAKTNPRSEEVLDAVNSGLRNIKASGLWFQTVRRHMSEFRADNT
jgi:polar amino acid transport system substrate-binding protein